MTITPILKRYIRDEDLVKNVVSKQSERVTREDNLK